MTRNLWRNKQTWEYLGYALLAVPIFVSYFQMIWTLVGYLAAFGRWVLAALAPLM